MANGVFLGIPKFQNVKFLQWWLAFIGFVCKPLHISFIQNYHHPNLPSEDVGGPNFSNKKPPRQHGLTFRHCGVSARAVTESPELVKVRTTENRGDPDDLRGFGFSWGKNPWDSHKMMQIETFGWCRLIECLICLVIFDGENIFIIDSWGFSVLEILSWYGASRWVAI